MIGSGLEYYGLEKRAAKVTGMARLSTEFTGFWSSLRAGGAFRTRSI